MEKFREQAAVTSGGDGRYACGDQKSASQGGKSGKESHVDLTWATADTIQIGLVMRC